MESGNTGAHLRHVHGILLLDTGRCIGRMPRLQCHPPVGHAASVRKRLRRPAVAGVPYCVPTAPAAFRMGVQRATSLLTKLARASGERPGLSGITLPSSSRRLRVASSSSALTSVSLSFAMISLGVPLGANSAFQALT